MNITRRRDLAKYTEDGHNVYQSENELYESTLNEGLSSTLCSGTWFDFRFIDRGADTTLISFSAAIPPMFETYPIFSAAPIAENLGLNYLGFSDPAYGGDVNLPTFWHLGVENVESRVLVPSTIDKLLMHKGPHNLCFFGSSAGGFAALRYAMLYPEAQTVVMNPRINLLNMPKRFPEYSARAFPSVDRMDLLAQIPYNLAKAYHELEHGRVRYIQNLEDRNYRLGHFDHFKKAVCGDDKVEFITGNWGQGHVVPPEEVYMNALRESVKEARQ
ncbi:hypothetical protein [Glutamicibacter endophyticus]|uniref:hypothetical protein n=1 Tax=Glutamicibacter endophyticus TaxID=1522174 RepID=UPI003AF19A05